MKKQLPNNSRNSVGFTLIELLVVIAIIAVLAVMGMAIFSSLTGRGNDDRRRADLKSISDAFEVARSNNSTYIPITVNSFAGGTVPSEPTTRTEKYCYTDGTAVINNPTNAQWATGNACPTAGSGNGTTWMTIGGATLPTVSGTNCAITTPANCTPTYYKVCALPEDRTQAPICFGSKQ